MKKVIYSIFIIIVIVVGVIIVLDIKNNGEGKESKVKLVSMDEAFKIMNEESNYIILDVRTIDEYNEGHIPNAICVPNETIKNDIVNKLPNKEQLILIYCRSGNRSSQAASKLAKLGYTNLIDIGGIIDWKGNIIKEN